MARQDGNDLTDKMGPWPLLVAGIFGIGAALVVISEPQAEEASAFMLIAISAMVLGSWITLLARSGYEGREPVKDHEPEHDTDRETDAPRGGGD